jgi:hypothetical protein
MPLYELTLKNGSTIQVEGPQGASAADLVNIYNRQTDTSGLAQERAIQEEIAARRAKLRATAPTREAGVLDYLGEIPKGLAAGAAGLVESAALGAITPLDEEAELAARESIQSAGRGVREYLEPDIGLEEAVPRKFSEALGSFGAIGLASLIPGVGVPLAGGLAVGAGAGEASERARAAGATEEERAQAARLGALVGAGELLPIKFIKALGRPTTGDIVDRLKRIGASAGVEGAQEAAAEIAQNLIEQGIYNPEQGTFTNTGEALGYGAGVGGFVQALVDIALPRQRGPSGGEKKPVPPRQADLFEDDAPAGTQMDMFAEELAAEQTVTPTEETELSTVDERQLDMFGEELGLTPEQTAQAQQLDLIDEMETAEIEAMLADDQRRAELVTRIGERNVAELERAREVGPELQAREAETAQQRRVEQRAASEAETAAGAEITAVQQEQAQRRESALQEIIAADPRRTPDIRGTFQAVLESGGLSPQLTETEERMVRRAEDLRAAEDTVPRQLPSTPEDTQLAELEAAIPQRQLRGEQLTLEGVPSRRQEKRAQRLGATEPARVEEPAAIPQRQLRGEQLTLEGVPSRRQEKRAQRLGATEPARVEEPAAIPQRQLRGEQLTLEGVPSRRQEKRAQRLGATEPARVERTSRSTSSSHYRTA